MDILATRVYGKNGGHTAEESASRSSARNGQSETTSPLQLSAEIYGILTVALARHLGPVSTHLIRNAASHSRSLPEMIDTLSLHIPKGAERDTFLDRAHRNDVMTHPGRSLDSVARQKAAAPVANRPKPKYKSSVGTALSEEKLQRLTQLLSRYVGPLAGCIVRKCREESPTEIKLYQAMAECIPDEHERTQFLNKVRLRSY
ncbi:hypothetical protein O5O45_18370 [Hahella aquimaris]|uniref:hypothetical protein n=1 Tax=Hahella sp. HNIBRBA332 TaxID=3015983 RepID=UPI00273B9342|nr:hypothetical protein [Hahella sp. HNIBRBA332]WLQ11695.1 hypothetical protein O5O45_18370 [Hahella sp. HNIBRBA332]